MSGTCTGCGAVLSDDYVRVNGDRNGRVSSCPHCSRGADEIIRNTAPPQNV
jgi:hypothetical protein